MEKFEQDEYKELEEFLEKKIQKDKEKNNFVKNCKKIIFSPIFNIISIIISVIIITKFSFFFHCKLKHDKTYRCENYWKNNDAYEGELKNGKRHGEGIYISENEFCYIGEWKEDKMDGEGIFIKNNGEAYRGIWENGEIIEGRYGQSNINIKKRTIILTKEFFDELFLSIWNKIIDNKDYVDEYYEGTFKDWKFNGKGKYIYENGDIYEGKFKDYKYNGYGKMIYKNGDKYEGDFKDNKFDGKGKFTWKKKNEEYDGQWKNGKRHGEGTMISYGKIYNSKVHGIWENDELIKIIK